MLYAIREIEYTEVEPVWRDYLWKGRQSQILDMSSMVLGGGVDISIYERFCPRFVGAFVGDRIVGVQGGHLTSTEDFRLRGLFVFPDCRRWGIANSLLENFTQIAKIEGAKKIWTFPKAESWPIYQKFGFVLGSEWQEDELGFHAYAYKSL